MTKLALHIFWLCLFLLLAARLEAATYYVAKTGGGSTCSQASPCLTIATGIGKLASGDTLEIATGSYAEGIDASNIPSGKNGAPTIIRGAAGVTVTLTGTATDCGAPYQVCVISKDYITFDNLIFDGQNIAEIGVWLSGSPNPSNISVRNSTVKNFTGDAGIVGGADNIYLGYNTIFHGTRPSGNLSHGIYLGGYARTAIIEHNNISDVTGYGIQQYHTNQIGQRNNLFRFNYIHEAAGTGGMYVGDDDSSSVYGNIIANSTGGGLRLNYGESGGGSTKVYNNTIYNSGGDCIEVGVDTTNVVIDNNLCIDNANNSIADSGTNTTIGSKNLFTTAALTVTDAANGDFRLKSTSPAKDAGVALDAAYASDYGGAFRPADAGWDIGAYEYTGTPAPTPALVLAMPFDAGEGNTAVDLSGFNNNGSFSTGVTWDNSGKYGKALAFAGTGGVTIQPSSSLDLTTGFTLEAWVNVASTSAVFRTIMVRMRPDGTDEQYALYVSSETSGCNSGWAYGEAVASQTWSQNIVCDTSPFPTNQWVHLAATYGGAGTSLILYRDGQIVSTTTPPGTPVTSSGSLYIGWNPPYTEAIIGKLDEIRVYNYPRTQAEIQTDMATPLTPTGPTAVIKISPATSLKLSATNGALKVGQ